MANQQTLQTLLETEVSQAVAQLWEKQLIVAAEKRMFWHNYEGPQGSGMPIIRKDDLSKEPGDRINVQTLSNLTGAGVTEHNTLRGNEEDLVLGQFTITPTLRRHAVATDKLTQMRVNFNIRNAAMGRLAYWLADKIDQNIFTQAVTSRTYTQFAGDAANEAALNTGDELDYTEVGKIKTQLKANRALPIMVGNGYEMYCMVVHPYDAHYLKRDTSTLNWANLQQYANERGELNPVFTGAVGVLDGMIIKESDNVPSITNGGGFRVSKMIAFGGEALGLGYAQYPSWAEQIDDYEFQYGAAISAAWGTANAVQENIVMLEATSTAITD